MNPELQRIREYLQGQAAQKSIPELIERVQEAVSELDAAARAANPASFGQRQQGEEWSGLDCLRHIAATNVAVGRQVLHAALTGVLPGERDEVPLPDSRDPILARMAADLDSLYAHVREADPTAHLDLKWDHPMFGDLNWREWLLFLRIHSRDHARQIAALSAASAGGD